MSGPRDPAPESPGVATALKMASAPSKHRFPARICAAAALALVALCEFASSAWAGIYGSTPVSISSGIGRAAPNGSSGEPAVSGDNRAVRFVAYSSYASNLVSGDSNGVRDVFAWFRPTNRVPRALRSGRLQRVSVGRNGQANGESSNPSVDGSMVNRPHCVAFQSTATNLSREGRAARQRHLRARPAPQAHCARLERNEPATRSTRRSPATARRSSLSPAGKIYWSRVGAGKPQVARHRHRPALLARRQVDHLRAQRQRRSSATAASSASSAAGSEPRVSDYATSHGWAVAYNSGGNAKVGDHQSRPQVGPDRCTQRGRRRRHLARRPPRHRRLGPQPRALLPEPQHRQLGRPGLRPLADHRDRLERSSEPDRICRSRRRVLHRRPRQPHQERLREVAAQVALDS